MLALVLEELRGIRAELAGLREAVGRLEGRVGEQRCLTAAERVALAVAERPMALVAVVLLAALLVGGAPLAAAVVAAIPGVAP